MARKRALHEILGSQQEPASVLFVLFIPSKTKDSKDLPRGQDQRMWASNASHLLSEIFTGATEMPPAKGYWRNDDNEVIEEEIVLVHSYAQPEAATDEGKLLQLAKFLHRMGHETKQGEIGLVIDNVFHRIRDIPLAKGGSK